MCTEGGSRGTKTRGRGWSDLPSAMDLKVSFNQLSDDFFLLCLSPPVSLFFSLKVWELCCAGGSSHTALRRPRRCQLVLSRAQEGTGMRVCFCLFVYVLLHFSRLILQESGIWIYSWGSPHPFSAFITYMFSLAHAPERLQMIFPPRFNSTCSTSS